MTLSDAPKWIQGLVVDKALGFLEAEENGEQVRVEVKGPDTAVIEVGRFRYTADRLLWKII